MGDHGHLRGVEETLSDQVGCGGQVVGRRSGGRMGLVHLRGGWQREGFPTPGGVLPQLGNQWGWGRPLGE